MKKILCYGDSNTFGFNPIDGSRFDENTRWTALLQANLKNDFLITEEGMCDRTGFADNTKGFLFSAQRYFPKFLSKSERFNIIILALGTNDLQFQYDIGFNAVQRGLAELIKKAQEKSDSVIIIPPVILNENILKGYFKIQFDEMSIVKSRKIGTVYRKLSNAFSCRYFDINKIVLPSDTDGLHYDAAAHKIIADKLAEFIIKGNECGK